MPNFVKIPRQMKKFSMQALDSDSSVNMAAICYSLPLYTISSEIVLLAEVIIHAKFRENNSSNKKVFQAGTFINIIIITAH